MCVHYSCASLPSSNERTTTPPPILFQIAQSGLKSADYTNFGQSLSGWLADVVALRARAVGHQTETIVNWLADFSALIVVVVVVVVVAANNLPPLGVLVEKRRRQCTEIACEHARALFLPPRLSRSLARQPGGGGGGGGVVATCGWRSSPTNKLARRSLGVSVAERTVCSTDAKTHTEAHRHSGVGTQAAGRTQTRKQSD